jgi:hypothetical protein
MTLFGKTGWLLLATLTMGCAVERTGARPLARPYTAVELSTIMHLREEGHSLSDVAAVVGGTRVQVKQAESAAKLRRTARAKS